MNIAVCENNNLEIKNQIKAKAPVIIIKNFADKEVCNKVVESAHLFTKKNKPKIGNRFIETFWQIDVLPSRVQTDRIFRSLCIYPNDNIPIVNQTEIIFKKMELLQNECLEVEKFLNDRVKRRPQIIHYPQGGGFFDWHKHPRFPTNYGLILNLSKKGRDFEKGGTEFKIETGEKISTEEYADIGDLILFRYDLPHSVSKCDSDEDLSFSKKGRWTAVLPLLDFQSNA